MDVHPHVVRPLLGDRGVQLLHVPRVREPLLNLSLAELNLLLPGNLPACSLLLTYYYFLPFLLLLSVPLLAVCPSAGCL